MLNFLKSPCSDADLFGYFVQCVGGVYNLSLSIEDGGFSKENLLRCMDASIVQRRRKIDNKQSALIQFAVEIVVLGVNTEKIPDVKKDVQRIAELKKEDNFDFLDSSVVQLRNKLENYGCIFNF